MTGYRSLLADPTGPKFNGKVTVFWPEEDAYETQTDPSLGWTRAASQVEVQPVPGGHVTCITEHYPDMAARIQAALDQASSASAGSAATAFH
jgi:thioesterase domain-containing protein